jgi:hypothetical protein
MALTQEAGGPLVVRTGDVRTESLGNQTIDSLTAVGTRETRTTVSGPRVILSHLDLWYSPDLQMYLSVARSNPQLGQVTLTVTDLVRGGPDHSWFDVPPGFEVNGRRSQ